MIVYYHIYTESRKTALMNLLAGHAQRLRRREHSRGSRGWAKLRERESNTALHTPPRERWILSGKLLHKAAWGSWRPAGAGWYADVGGRSSRGRGHMYTYLLVHTVIWQKPTQHCIAIILQYKKNKAEGEIQRFSTISETTSSTKAHFSMSVSPQVWRTAAPFPVKQSRTVVLALTHPRVLYCCLPMENLSHK